MLEWLAKIFGEASQRKLESFAPLVEQINALEPDYKKLSDEELRGLTVQFRQKLAEGKTLDEILPDAFAAVREASVRTTGMRHFDVQLIGGLVLHQGKIAEMKTGEGKTLVATLPLFLNALEGKGAHLVTVNDYLAKRDSEWMGAVFRALGMEVGVIQNYMEPPERKIAYAADITYGTNNEFGFDYLRDAMATSIEECVQRDLHYAIVDEVDSILIDEARTPLIISGMVEETVSNYIKANEIAKRLAKATDFTVDEKTKNTILTEHGTKKVEKLLNVEYLFDVAHMDLAHQLIQSLRAWHAFQKNVDYVVKDGEVLIVDEFTGRLMVGRRYSEGLHQAIEAKEGVEVQNESQTLATITFQNYFRLFKKIAGMTGTAKTEEAEFWKIYKLEVIQVPTHFPMIRKDHSDLVYKNKRSKFRAVVNEIAEWHKKGRPVLVGTISIENSELLSEMIQRRGIPHHVLNAKHHEREADIISKAGQRGMVTISTNMAGRGTDIVLGEGVADLGGLHVIGTERHESRRIDNQLRGRSGRQGDQGSSRFYVSLEDDLMRLFGSNRVSGMMERLGFEEDMPIEHKLISRAIENAQKKVEEYHFGMRKQVLEFDDVMNKQRESIYALRRRILEGNALREKIMEMINQLAEDKPEEERQAFIDELKKEYENKEAEVGEHNMREIERLVMLKVIDTAWIEQLHNMDVLKEGIGLRGWGGKDPLIEYKMEGYGMFQDMMRGVREQIFEMILKVQVTGGEEALPKKRIVSYGAPEKSEKPKPVKASVKVGRNDQCPCGSGKKYKKCCMKS
ncbi:MAG: preprotein translocase subunit SecA [bacterium]